MRLAELEGLTGHGKVGGASPAEDPQGSRREREAARERSWSSSCGATQGRRSSARRKETDDPSRFRPRRQAGQYEVETGIPFFDHMLESFAKHGALRPATCAPRATWTSILHHTVEDVGIVLGQAHAPGTRQCGGHPSLRLLSGAADGRGQGRGVARRLEPGLTSCTGSPLENDRIGRLRRVAGWRTSLYAFAQNAGPRSARGAAATARARTTWWRRSSRVPGPRPASRAVALDSQNPVADVEGVPSVRRAPSSRGQSRCRPASPRWPGSRRSSTTALRLIRPCAVWPSSKAPGIAERDGRSSAAVRRGSGGRSGGPRPGNATRWCCPGSGQLRRRRHQPARQGSGRRGSREALKGRHAPTWACASGFSCCSIRERASTVTNVGLGILPGRVERFPESADAAGQTAAGSPHRLERTCASRENTRCSKPARARTATTSCTAYRALPNAGGPYCGLESRMAGSSLRPWREAMSFAVQFHPEKSQIVQGKRVLDAFAGLGGFMRTMTRCVEHDALRWSFFCCALAVA